MEENDRRNPERHEDSEEESNRDIVPLRQAPGNQPPHRITNFYIDNILRPDFGRKRKCLTFNSEVNRIGIQRQEQFSGGVSKSGTQQQPDQGSNDKIECSGNSRPDQGVKKADIVAIAVPLKVQGDSGDQCLSSDSDSSSQASSVSSSKPMLWPAWVYCTRYSDRPSSGRPLSHVQICGV